MKGPHKDRTRYECMPDGTPIDFDSYDWGDVPLTKKQKLLIIWFTLPNQNGYMDATQAALKAGYSLHSAYNAKVNLIKLNPKVKDLIKKFSDDNLKIAVADACKQVISDKIKRATYNVSDFYEAKQIEITGKDGEAKTIYIPAGAKPLDEIPLEKRALIDNVEVNNAGVVTYRLPSREKEAQELLKLNADMNKSNDIGEYDVETTVDVIRDNLATVKTTIRLNNQKVKENAENYIENSENQPDFD